MQEGFLDNGSNGKRGISYQNINYFIKKEDTKQNNNRSNYYKETGAVDENVYV